MMTREEFKEALRVVASQEFANVPDNPPEHIFSQKYEKKMKRLLNSVSRHGKAPMSILNKATLITAACMIIFIASVTQIKAIREPFIELITTIYQAFAAVNFSGNGPAFIVQEYQLNYIPEGYTLTDKQFTTAEVYYKYESSNNTIIFIQKALKNDQVYIDNEQGNLSKLLISDIEILLYKSDSCSEARWSQDGYYMTLTCYGDFDEATIIKMIESTKAVEADTTK